MIKIVDENPSPFVFVKWCKTHRQVERVLQRLQTPQLEQLCNEFTCGIGQLKDLVCKKLDIECSDNVADDTLILI